MKKMLERFIQLFFGGLVGGVVCFLWQLVHYGFYDLNGIIRAILICGVIAFIRTFRKPKARAIKPRDLR